MDLAKLFSVEDKVALVTGGSRGLGLTLAGALARGGAHVGLLARSEQDLTEAASLVDNSGPGRTTYFVGDVSSEEDLDRFVTTCRERLGKLDIVIVNAANINRPRQDGWELSREIWEGVIDVSLTGAFLTCRRALQEMVPRGGGKIICIGSTSSLLASRGHAPYAAAKSGLMGLVRTLALEAAPHGINVNAIGPAYLRTEMTAPSLEDPARREQILASLPLGRIVETEDIVGACLFLATHASDMVTGQLLLVDGGMTLV